MGVDIIKGFAIGVCASVPMGPIAILAIQRTISKGRKAGFMVGLGASVVDTVFAIVAVFAYTYAMDILDKYDNLIFLAGGAVLCAIGISMSLSNPLKNKRAEATMINKKGNSSSMDFLQALAMGFSNPMAIAVLFSLFAFFKVEIPTTVDVHSSFGLLPTILSVSAGTVLYWYGLSWALSTFRNKLSLRTVLWFNRVMGAIVIIIGVTCIGQGLYNVVFLNKALM